MSPALSEPSALSVLGEEKQERSQRGHARINVTDFLKIIQQVICEASSLKEVNLSSPGPGSFPCLLKFSQCRLLSAISDGKNLPRALEAWLSLPESKTRLF